MREEARLLEQPFPMHCFFAETFRWDWIINFMSSVETGFFIADSTADLSGGHYDETHRRIVADQVSDHRPPVSSLIPHSPVRTRAVLLGSNLRQVNCRSYIPLDIAIFGIA